MPDDERLRAMVEDIIDRKLAAFKETVKEIVHSEIGDTLRRIGIRIDDEHIDATSDSIKSILRNQKERQELKSTGLREIVKIIVGYIGTGIIAAAAVIWGVKNSGNH